MCRDWVASPSSSNPTSSSPSSCSFVEELTATYGEDEEETVRWQRSERGPVDPASEDVVFQWMDMDMYDGDPLPKNPHAGRTLPGSRAGPVPVFRVFGVTRDGHSVVAHVHGFTPYMYVNLPPGFRPETDVGSLQAALEERLAAAAPKSGRRPPQFILHMEVVEKASLLGYAGGRRFPFLMIYLAMPSLVPTVRRLLGSGISFGSHRSVSFQAYESNIPFVLRYMVDSGITGCAWLAVRRGTYSVRSAATKTSGCQIELDVVYDSIENLGVDGEWQTLAPFRILSFDIECAGRKGHFPQPEEDPVIQIANVVTVQGESKSLIRNVFTLGTCSPIVGANVISFEKEADMLLAWARFVRETDSDVLTGYNIANFDLPYLLRRAEKLGIAREFSLLGRIRGKRATMKETTFVSAAFGKRENMETAIDGRLIFDMLQYMNRNHKLSSYSLNAVSAEFLGEQKEDVHHSIISDLQNGSADDRHRLAVYCLKDAFLPLRLMEKLMVLVNHVEMARVTGVPLDFLLKRGQQIKVVSMIYRKCHPLHLLIPTIEKQGGGGGGGDVGYEGATVIEPLKAFYDEPIATLDFASLYPSIMMAHNLCYSTLVAAEDVARLPADSYERTPSGDVFVKKDVLKGILPQILEELLAARKRAKVDMAAATDPMVQAVQNGRQLALKISANSVYGFTGATVGQLPCLAISSSVTAYGRDMIHATKEAVERLFTVENGYPASALVVYGDTDSVMVKFGVPDVPTAMKLGLEASQKVSALFPKPVKLEFEKVYFPYLLMNKKRYAGLYWSKPDRWDKLDAKGIETVRRDNCALVRQVVDTVLRKIIIERSIESAVSYTKGVISDLLQNKLDISLLVITKALGKGANAEDYAAKQAHVELAERMRKRDAASAPVVGDRVPYVIIEAAKGTPAYMKSEDPIYVLENNLTIDTKYYLENQLSKPLLRIFAPIIENPQALLVGDHTRTIAKPTPTAVKGGIVQFTQVKLSCVVRGCNVPLAKGQTTVCKGHEGVVAEAYRQRLEEVNDLEEKFSRLWTQCQRCQGSLHQDVLCTSRDCPIFYMRKKVQKDLETASTVLERFDLSW